MALTTRVAQSADAAQELSISLLDLESGVRGYQLNRDGDSLRRVARARELLTSTDSPIEDVATAAGFGSAATLRHHFRRQMKVSPKDYRRQFGPAP